MPIEFTLVYRGPLHARGANAEERQGIRDYFHPQLQILAHKSPEFGDWATREELPRGVRSGDVVDIRRPIEVTPFYIWEVAGYEFVPLVTYVHGLACEIDIEWFRRESPGSITSGGGDLDNRLKSLIDGLRMPMSEHELGGMRPGEKSRRRYCLLDDDRRITRIGVETHELLEEPTVGERPSGVELFIKVRVYSALLMNMNYPFQGR